MFLTSCPDTEERLRKEFVAYLNVHIAVWVEGAVDHMQGDIDVRYLVQQINYHRLLHFFTATLYTFYNRRLFFLIALRNYPSDGGRKKNAFPLPFSDFVVGEL